MFCSMSANKLPNYFKNSWHAADKRLFSILLDIVLSEALSLLSDILSEKQCFIV